MVNPIRPRPLRRGDHLRVVAPARSMIIIGEDGRAVADQRFADLGLTLSFGDHVNECDEFMSSSIESRVADLHAAFADPSVDGILTVIGGYSSNDLLPHLDWDLIAANPKVLCGYSDITVLACAIHARTGLVTFVGPHYSTFGMEQYFDDVLQWFTSAVMSDEPFVVQPASVWTDDEWFLDQNARTVADNDGYWIMREGHAQGRLVGGNLCAINSLTGTDHMPDLDGTVLFVEDDIESMPYMFKRDLTMLSQQPGFSGVRGLLIGRFQRDCEMSRDMLQSIIDSNVLLDGLPILANVDFGHTNPLLTMPVGLPGSFDTSAGTIHIGN